MKNLTPKELQELLATAWDRAEQYAIAKYGSKPDWMRFWPDSIVLCYSRSGCEDDEYEISIDFLTEDLQVVADIRKAEEEKARIAREDHLRQEKERRAVREKQERYQNYLKLKKEFEAQ